MMDSFVLLAQQVWRLQEPFATITSLSEFPLDSKDLFSWYKQKMWILSTMAAAQAAENHGDEWGLTWYLRWRMHSSIPTLTHSQNSLAEAEVLLCNIPQVITKTTPISMRIVKSYGMKWAIPFWVWWKVKRNWDKNMIRISLWRESHCRTNTRRNK